MTTYTITINATQAAVVSHACEVLARLGMGQYTNALECLPTKKLCPDGWHEDMQAIGHILSKHAPIHNIRNHKHEARRTAMSNVAWDVYQVTRHRLAWDRAKADGHTGDRPPAWGVSFDQPLQTSPEPLPQMTAPQTPRQATHWAVQLVEAPKIHYPMADPVAWRWRVADSDWQLESTCPPERPLAIVEPLCAGYMADAYIGAMEEVEIWKRRALEAEKKLQTEIASLTAENEALKAAASEAVAEERMVCAELMEQQHTWITNVAASALIRARGTP